MSVFQVSQVAAEDIDGFGVVSVADIDAGWVEWMAQVRATISLPSVWVDDVLVVEVA